MSSIVPRDIKDFETGDEENRATNDLRDEFELCSQFDKVIEQPDSEHNRTRDKQPDSGSGRETEVLVKNLFDEYKDEQSNDEGPVNSDTTKTGDRALMQVVFKGRALGPAIGD